MGNTQQLSARQIPPTGAGVVIDLPLSVAVPGQTKFNIFSTPPGLHNLIIDGVLYFETTHYNIINEGGNIKVEWLGEFSLSPSDELIFRKY